METGIEKSVWEKALPYLDYVALAEKLFSKGQGTSGPLDEEMRAYTKANLERQQRASGRFEIKDEALAKLKAMPPQRWVALSESWCGDASQSLPLFHKMAEAHPEISFRVLLREQNPAIMDRFLTNGGRSIPKVIALDQELNYRWDWGPRPLALQEAVMGAKAEGKTLDELSALAHRWYAKDRGQTTLAEVLAKMEGSI